MVLTAVLFAGTFSVWAAILQFHLRYIGLMALVLFAPLLPTVAACFIWYPWERWTEVPAVYYAIPAYIFGIAEGQILAENIARNILLGLSARATAIASLGRGVRTVGLVTVIFVAWMLATSRGSAPDNLAAALVLFSVGAGTLVIVSAAAWLPYSEQFIARANRAREQREILFEHFLFIAETRWSLSIAGVALIFVALSVFGMRPLRIQSGSISVESIAAFAALIFVGATAATRNWRLGTAFTCTVMLLGMIGWWIFARGNIPMLSGDAMICGILLATGALPSMVVSQDVATYLDEGDTVTAALLRALHKEGANAFLFALLPCFPWILVAVTGGYWRLQVAISLASLVAAPLIFPALAGAIYTICPRYRTVDEVFGKR